MATCHTISDSESDDYQIMPSKTDNSPKPSKLYTGEEDLFSDTDSDVTVDLSPCELSTSDTGNIQAGSELLHENISKESNKSSSYSGSKPYLFKHGTSIVHSISDSESDEDKKPKPISSKKLTKEMKPTTSVAITKVDNNCKTKEGTSVTEISVAFGVDKRPKCEYGSRCFRTNSTHFQDYQHPASMGKKRPSSEKQSPKSKRQRLEDAPTSSSEAGVGSTKRLSSKDAVEQCQPLSFMLTRVFGIARDFNDHMAVHIREILAPSLGNLMKSAQFNYCIDIQWLVAQYPEKFRKTPLLIVHGAQRAEKAALDTEAMAFDHVRLCQARLDMPYGTHHTKMMLLLYDSGLRVVIHTANLIDRDWYQKTQGVWMSPEFPKMTRESATEGDSQTHFKRDLLEYLGAYKARPLEEWCKVIREHDMSEAKVYIIGSIPGRHTSTKKAAFGHLKLRKLLQSEGPDAASLRGWPVVGQFSSIGSLGAQKEAWVAGEWQESLGACRGSPLGISGHKPKLHLIFPSKENVRVSLEGYPAGQSVPYSMNTARKQTWLHDYFHEWKSLCRGRSHASPHIKTYLRASPDWKQLAWFLVTSANLSKAAWGAFEKNGSQLMIRSYELGVLFLPKQFGSASTFRVLTKGCKNKLDADGHLLFPMPYDLPPTPYAKTDKPWIWDIAYKDKPDSHGNMWCPS